MLEVIGQMMGGGGMGEELKSSLQAQCAQGNTEACAQLAAMLQAEQQMRMQAAAMKMERQQQAERAEMIRQEMERERRERPVTGPYPGGDYA